MLPFPNWKYPAIALILLLAICGVFYIYEHVNPPQPEEEKPTCQTEEIYIEELNRCVQIDEIVSCLKERK